MFKKILAFLIKIPHSLIAIMRFLFSPDWQFATPEPSAHCVKDGQLVSDADTAIYFFKTSIWQVQSVGKEPKGIMFRGIMPKTTKSL
jgi:hypothetical protein